MKFIFFITLVLFSFSALSGSIVKGMPLYGKIFGGLENDIYFKFDLFKEGDFRLISCDTSNQPYAMAEFEYIGDKKFSIIVGSNLYYLDESQTVSVYWFENENGDCRVLNNIWSENASTSYTMFFNSYTEQHGRLHIHWMHDSINFRYIGMSDSSVKNGIITMFR